MNSELSFEEVVYAYFECRKRKRHSAHQLEFEFDLEKNLFTLFEELLSGTYQIGRSIAFVVEQPKIREIWAATFRDRVVHHLIYNRLKTRFYPSFINNSFACIPNRGALFGSDKLMSGMRSITQNWQRPAYYLSGDVRNFFVSIHKPTLFHLLEKKLYEPWLLELTRQVLFHDPKTNCFLKSKRQVFNRVPKYKSLWSHSKEQGLPIGNLTSQFFANVYLNELDQYVKHTLKVKYYYRYVDDFVILHENSDFLNDCFYKINSFLHERLFLELHPFKKRLGLIDQGIDFVGFFHKPFRRYPRRRTAERAKSVVIQWKKGTRCFDFASLIQFRATMNSYLGLLRQTSSYRLRKYLGDKVRCLFVWPNEKYTKFIILKLKRN